MDLAVIRYSSSKLFKTLPHQAILMLLNPNLNNPWDSGNKQNPYASCPDLPNYGAGFVIWDFCSPGELISHLWQPDLNPGEMHERLLLLQDLGFSYSARCFTLLPPPFNLRHISDGTFLSAYLPDDI